MSLTEDDIAAAVYCAREVVRSRRRNGTPIPAWLNDHLAKLESATNTTSETGSDIGETDSAAGTVEHMSAAQLAAHLGISSRAVRQRATHHGGQLVGDRWIFPTPATESADDHE